MSETEIVFEALPAARQGRTLHSLVAAQLRQRPTEWAMIAVRGTAGHASSTAHSIRTASQRSYAPAGAYEAHSRTVDGQHRVYARYVGDTE